jgi:hypothetical protein
MMKITKGGYKMSEEIGKKVEENTVPEVDMDAISAAINSALGSEGTAAGSAEAQSFVEKIAPDAAKKAKGSGMKLKDVSSKSAAPKEKEAPGEEVPKEKKARAAAAPNPEKSSFGTPIIRAARDKCSGCNDVVKWYSTTNDKSEPIWECSVCGRIVPRRSK